MFSEKGSPRFSPRGEAGAGEAGQTLLELIVVMAVSIIIIGALVFATISSLRNAQFSKNQAQATKLAQEGIEKTRSARDRMAAIGGGFTIGAAVIDSWDDVDLWNYQISSNCIPVCYFKFNDSAFLYLTAANDVPSSAEDPFAADPVARNKFKRVIILSDDGATFRKQKTITSIVIWTDFSGTHNSRLTTILRKI